MTDPNASMTAFVEFQIRTDETTMGEWLDEWQKRAQDALEAEPETTAYAAAVSLEDESCVLVYEHYAHGTASLKFHVERPSHAVLTETMGARRMTKRPVTAFWQKLCDVSPVLARVDFDDLTQKESNMAEAATRPKNNAWKI